MPLEMYQTYLSHLDFFHPIHLLFWFIHFLATTEDDSYDLTCQTFDGISVKKHLDLTLTSTNAGLKMQTLNMYD